MPVQWLNATNFCNFRKPNFKNQYSIYGTFQLGLYESMATHSAHDAVYLETFETGYKAKVT